MATPPSRSRKRLVRSARRGAPSKATRSPTARLSPDEQQSKRRLVLGLALFVALQFVVLGVVGTLPSALKATLGVAGIGIAVAAVRWYRNQPQ